MAGLEQDTRRRRRPAAQYRCHSQADIDIARMLRRRRRPPRCSANLSAMGAISSADRTSRNAMAFLLGVFVGRTEAKLELAARCRVFQSRGTDRGTNEIQSRLLMKRATSRKWFASLRSHSARRPRRTFRHSARPLPHPAVARERGPALRQHGLDAVRSPLIRFDRRKCRVELMMDARAIADIPGFITGRTRPHRLAFHEIALVTAGAGQTWRGENGRSMNDHPRHAVRCAISWSAGKASWFEALALAKPQ